MIKVQGNPNFEAQNVPSARICPRLPAFWKKGFWGGEEGWTGNGDRLRSPSFAFLWRSGASKDVGVPAFAAWLGKMLFCGTGKGTKGTEVTERTNAI
jgi:hypothetical protein